MTLVPARRGAGKDLLLGTAMGRAVADHDRVPAGPDGLDGQRAVVRREHGPNDLALAAQVVENPAQVVVEPIPGPRPEEQEQGEPIDAQRPQGTLGVGPDALRRRLEGAGHEMEALPRRWREPAGEDGQRGVVRLPEQDVDPRLDGGDEALDGQAVMPAQPDGSDHQSLRSQRPRVRWIARRRR